MTQITYGSMFSLYWFANLLYFVDFYENQSFTTEDIAVTGTNIALGLTVAGLYGY